VPLRRRHPLRTKVSHHTPSQVPVPETIAVNRQRQAPRPAGSPRDLRRRPPRRSVPVPAPLRLRAGTPRPLTPAARGRLVVRAVQRRQGSVRVNDEALSTRPETLTAHLTVRGPAGR